MPDSSNTQDLQQLDEENVSKLHWKVMLVSGMGFFTDAYDLFIIGVVMGMIKQEWHPSAVETGLITSTALLASAVGAILFGRVADLLGRKRIYGVEVLVLAAGAVASALSPNMACLIVFRIILGLGIGGDYPVSATIMSEYAGKRTRGMLVSLVFAMQAAGLIFGLYLPRRSWRDLVRKPSPGASCWPSVRFRRFPCITRDGTSAKRRDFRRCRSSGIARKREPFVPRAISGAVICAWSRIDAC
jgi:hypothetical protein